MTRFVTQMLLILPGVVSLLTCQPRQTQRQLSPTIMPYTVTDILAALDKADANDLYNSFFDLEHPYVYTAGSAITLFADSTRWAIVMEKSGYNPRAGYPQIELYYFGNCLQNLDRAGSKEQFVCNMKWLLLLDWETVQNLTDHADFIKRAFMEVNIRGRMVRINQNPADYERIGIQIDTLDNPNRLIDYTSLLRYWADTQPSVLLATETELRTCLPADLPPLIRIDKWHHKQYSVEHGVGVKPSNYETYRMMGEILVKRDISRWKPTLKPNNDWRNWPEAGSL
jgi:hypothetical protein